MKDIKDKNNGPMIIFFIILLVLIIISIIVFYNIKQYSISAHYPEKSPTDNFTNYIDIDDEILEEYSYSALTELYTYYGKLITTKGDIYNFNCNNTNEYDATKCITKYKGTISYTDLNLINNYIKGIDANYETKTISNEEGEITISFNKNGEIIILEAKGDSNITNTSKDSKKLIKILKKYEIYI